MLQGAQDERAPDGFYWVNQPPFQLVQPTAFSRLGGVYCPVPLSWSVPLMHPLLRYSQLIQTDFCGAD
jgi:hypothetical protein